MIKRLTVYTTFKEHGANMFHLIIVHDECLLWLASSFDMNVYHIVRVNSSKAIFGIPRNMDMNLYQI